ncbi:ribosome assembly factor SBDS [Candidatus Pacearchaeota archaeon]|nr:MAG: ribosome assembly factor SBDS [Candidatus Pacearchaeota archaeon]
MVNTTARITRGGKHFEILVDLEEAMKVRKGEPGANLASAVLTEDIFNNLKAGERASRDDLEIHFGTSDVMAVAEKIICNGEVVRTAESLREEREKKYKQVIDILSRMAVSPEGLPYPPERIKKALEEAKVNIKNKPIDSQINEIVEQISKVLPLKVEVKKVKLIIPAQYTGRAYAIVKEFMKEENWLSNGNLEAVVEIPTALSFDFYERLNNVTHGSVLSEEVKD